MQLIPGCSKRSRCEARMDVIVSVKRDREDRTSTITLHEPNSSEAIERNR